MEIVKIQLKNLTIDPDNSKQHPDYQIDEIVTSIKQFGFNDPIGVWGENNIIVEGEGRYRALLRLGYTDAECIRLDHLDESARKAYAIAHNAINMASGFDTEKLQATLQELYDKFDMSALGVNFNDLDDAVLAKEDNFNADGEYKTRVKLGDIWQMGRHRLICGDSTDAVTIDRLFNGGGCDLCVTDPPYNTDYGETDSEAIKRRKFRKDGLKIKNDKMPEERFFEFLKNAFQNVFRVLKPGGAYYVWLASGEHVNFETALSAANLPVREQLIWVKNRLILGRQDYQWQHEPCLYGWKPGAAHYFRDDRTQTTVQEDDKPQNLKKLKKEELLEYCKKLIDERDKNESTVIREDSPPASKEHPTMKPIRLIARFIANSTRRDEVVFDPFGGSGSTLIACEQLGRQCRIAELDEHYATVIIERWEAYTGQKAVKVGIQTQS